MVRRVGTPTIFSSPRAHERLEEALRHLRARTRGAEGLAVGASLDALTDLYAVLAREGRAVFGEHRTTLMRLAAQLAAPRLAAKNLSPAGPLPLEALCARVVASLHLKGALGRFSDVATRPGLPRAIARTLRELRAADVSTHELEKIDADLALILVEYEAELLRHGLADRALVLRVATERVHKGDTPLAKLPLLLFDVKVEPGLETKFVAAVAAGSPSVLATVPHGDTRTEDALSLALQTDVVRSTISHRGSSLERLQSYLFEERELPRASLGSDVMVISAPGESRECVEVVRVLRDEAERGTPFDEMAVLLRTPGSYRPHLVEALRRAGIPAAFTFGTKTPDPAGRAFLALLACAAEDYSAPRFAEYLSLGEVPDATLAGEPPPAAPATERWAVPDEEMLPLAMARAAATDEDAEGEGVPEIAETAPVAAGSLRTPRRWEHFLTEAAVIGGEPRYAERLDRLKNQYEASLTGIEDPESLDGIRIRRDLDDLARLRAFALPLIEQLATLPKQALWGEWLDKLGALATRAIRTPARVLSVLAELLPMSTVGPVELSEVRLVLGQRLADLVALKKEKRYGRVLVGPIEAARGMAFDVVIVPGLAERLFPQKVTEDPIMPDGARRALALMQSALETNDDRIEKERLALKIAVGSAKKRAVLTYPRVDMDQSRPRVPSFYGLEVLRAAEGRLPGFDEMARRAEQGGAARIGWPAPEKSHDAIDDAEHDLALLEELFRLPEAETDGNARYLLSVNPHLARALRFRAQRWEVPRFTGADGLVMREEKRNNVVVKKPLSAAIEALKKHSLQNRSFSPTALQTFASCPYKFLLYTVYKLAPRETPSPIEELDALSRGSLVHETQFELLQSLQNKGLLPFSRDMLEAARKELYEVLTGVSNRYKNDLLPSIERVWEDTVAGIYADLIEWLKLVTRDAEERGWQPSYFELSFGLPDRKEADANSQDEPVPLDCGLRLRGSIDLVEKRRDGSLRATDHKTGKARAEEGERIAGGERLQAVLYALALEKLFPKARVEGGRLFYCTSAGGFENVQVPLDLDAREKADVVAYTIGQAIDTAFLPAAPAPGACRFCDYRPVCGPYEEERIRRKRPDELMALKKLREQT
ncbi:MAG: PD-(D/E)XK nuclease family protein [Polyangiaceae bacterium]|nr:PD-(D/E)XK nuclease family protein [Polyangiaceae bacterium]